MRYLIILLLALGVAGCGGSESGDDTGTEYTVMETEALTLHVEQGLFLPQPGRFAAEYSNVAECAGVIAPPPDVYLVDRAVTDERFAGIGIAFRMQNGRMIVDGRKPESMDTQEFVERMAFSTGHLGGHYLIWHDTDGEYAALDHNHDYFNGCVQMLHKPILDLIAPRLSASSFRARY